MSNQAFKSIDTNSNKEINFAEFKESFSTTYEVKHSPNKEKKAREVFDLLDKNNNGKLDKKELWGSNK